MHPIFPSWHHELEKCVNTQAVNPPMLTIRGNKSPSFSSYWQSAVLTGSKICSSLFMMWFSEGKIHSKTLKHCFIKSSSGSVPDFSGQVFAAWHIFGRLIDNGGKHKFWQVFFFYSQWSLIAADLGNWQWKCHCLEVLQPGLGRCECPAHVSNS